MLHADRHRGLAIGLDGEHLDDDVERVALDDRPLVGLELRELRECARRLTEELVEAGGPIDDVRLAQVVQMLARARE